MKTIYSQPKCEITELTLVGSFLDEFPIGGPSGGGLPTNEAKFDDEEEEFNLAGNINLWDE